MSRKTHRPKAYSYMRFSSPEQAKGASRRRQIEAAERYAAEHDLELDETLRDEGVSAFRGANRDATSALGAFLDRVRTGLVAPGSYLLVESFDRLSREQVLDALELFLSLTRAGITIVTLSDGREYNRESLQRDHTQLIISIVVMSRAHEESAIKSQRVGDAWRRKREGARSTQQAMTARCPGWIKLVGGPRRGRYELIPERAKIVQNIFAETIAGDGRRTISKRLNEHGIIPWGSGKSQAKFWHDSYIQKILSSPATFGRYEKDGESIEGYFPPVIDEEIFWKAKAAAAARGSGKGRTSRHFGNILKGLCRCSSCGSALIYLDKGGGSRPVLKCSKAHASGGCNDKRSFTYRPIEILVLEGYAHCADAVIFATQERTKNAESAVSAAIIRRAQAAQRRDYLIAAIEEGIMIPEIRMRLDALGVEIDEIDKELVILRTEIGRSESLPLDIVLRWNMIEELMYAEDLEEQYRGRALINARLTTIFEKIVVIEDEKIEYYFRHGYENIDRQMTNLTK